MVGCVEEPVVKGLKKAGGNWVDGDRFFDREAELEALSERVREGTHTLLTAQRRMGKTSLVRELLRRLADERKFKPFSSISKAQTTPRTPSPRLQSRHDQSGPSGAASGPVSQTS